MISASKFRVGDRVEVAHRVYRGCGGNNFRGEIVEIGHAECRVKMDDPNYDEGIPASEGGGVVDENVTAQLNDGHEYLMAPHPDPGYAVCRLKDLRPLSLLELIAEAAETPQERDARLRHA
jgi:hypothetical protein